MNLLVLQLLTMNTADKRKQELSRKANLCIRIKHPNLDNHRDKNYVLKLNSVKLNEYKKEEINENKRFLIQPRNYLKSQFGLYSEKKSSNFL